MRFGVQILKPWSSCNLSQNVFFTFCGFGPVVYFVLGAWGVLLDVLDISIPHSSCLLSPRFWSWRVSGWSSPLGPAGWSVGTCDVWWDLPRGKWNFSGQLAMGRPCVLGVEPVSRHMSMREEGEVTLGCWEHGGQVYWNLGKKGGIYILI